MVFLADEGTEGCVDFRFDGLLERRDARRSGGRDKLVPLLSKEMASGGSDVEVKL